MSDVFTPQKRSEVMSRVRGRDTKPELAVRSAVHRMGYRFRLHRRDLPGSPDLVLPRHRKIVFVHGCFWHGHKGCKRSGRPASNADFWSQKLSKNVQRDLREIRALRQAGWRVLIVWECQTKDLPALERRLRGFLES